MSKLIILIFLAVSVYAEETPLDDDFAVETAGELNFGETLQLDELVNEVLARNSALLAAEKMAEAERAKAGATGYWPDPSFSVALSNLPSEEMVLDRTPMSGIQLNLSQKIPFPGKDYYRRKAADAGADAIEQDYLNMRNMAEKRSSDAFLDLYLLERHIHLLELHSEYLQDFTKIAESRYATGLRPIHDVFRAQVESSLKIEELITLKQRREVAYGRINVLLARPPGEELPPPGDFSLPDINYTLEELQEMVLTNSPVLSSSEYSLEKARAGRSLSKLGYVPDFKLGVGYRIREEVTMDPVADEDFWTFSVGFNVPIFTAFKQGHNVDAASAKMEMSQAKLDDARYQILMDVQDLYLQVEEYSLKIDLYEEAVLPQSEQSLASALSGYRAGKVDFLTLLDNEIMLLNREKMYYKIIVNYRKKLAALEATVGTKLYSP
jgi:outer membrane protein TolC